VFANIQRGSPHSGRGMAFEFCVSTRGVIIACSDLLRKNTIIIILYICFLERSDVYIGWQ